MATTDGENLRAVFKAYDVRGIVPDQLDEEVARALGAAFVRGDRSAERVVVGHDMRPVLAGLVAAFAEGATAPGADVVEIGLASTDQLYFASGSLDLPGAMFTASHNPAQYNGIKLCRAGARPVGQDTGLAEIRDLRRGRRRAQPPTAARHRSTEHGPARRPTPSTCATLVDLSRSRPLKVVVDAGNGMGGHTVPAVLGAARPSTSCRCTSSWTAPSPTTRPTRSTRRTCVDLQAAVREERRRHRPGLRRRRRPLLRRRRARRAGRPSAHHRAGRRPRAGQASPGSTVIHNLITSRAVPEIVTEHGGTPVRTRVGHSFIKAEMAETDAVFGGEHSAHYYFRDFWRADTGMLAALHVLAALGEQRPAAVRAGRGVRALRRLRRDQLDGRRPGGRGRGRCERAYAGRAGVEIDDLDGLTVTSPATGGSTCAPPTPSRCCGSTSRRPTQRRMDRRPRRGAARA